MAVLEANFGSRASCSVEVDDVIMVSSAHQLRQKFAYVLVNTEPDLDGALEFYVGNGGTVFERFTSWSVPVAKVFSWTSTPFPAGFVDAVAEYIDGTGSYEMDMWVALKVKSETYDDRVKVKVRIGDSPETSPSFDLSAVGFGPGSDYGILQNLTQIRAEVANARVEKGDIESVVVKCLGWRSDSTVLVTPAIYKSGTVEVEATVASTLNVATRKTIQLECIPYERPGISSATVFRCLEDGTAKDDAAWARAEAEWAFPPLDGDNWCSATVSYRPLGSDAWSEPVALPNGEAIVIAGDLDMTVSYEALFTVADRFATAQGILDIAIPYFTIDLLKGGRGIAFGTAATEEGFKVGMDAKFSEAAEMAKSLTVAGDSHAGNILLDRDPRARVMRAGRSDSWVGGHRDGSLVNVTSAPGDGSYSGALSMRTAGGNWGVGVLREQLAFSFISKADFDAGNNTARVVNLERPLSGNYNISGMARSGTGNYWGLRDPNGADTEWVRTTKLGLIPYDTSGANSVLGTSGWKWKDVQSVAFHGGTFYNANGNDMSANRVLWSGCLYMGANQTATLSQSRSAQPNGVVLVWCPYNTSNQMLSNSLCCFVPKSVNGNCYFPLFSEGFRYLGGKVVGIWGTSITGNAASTNSGTKNGVTYNNARWVLSKVIGV